MKSINATLEESLLEKLRSVDTGVDCFGLLEVAASGEVKQEDLTAIQVRVHDVRQLHEPYDMYSAVAEIRLNVEQAESANGELFYRAHEAVALWVQLMMLDDNCISLSTDDAYVDGLQLSGNDADYDSNGGIWYSIWNLTLSGRLKKGE